MHTGHTLGMCKTLAMKRASLLLLGALTILTASQPLNAHEKGDFRLSAGIGVYSYVDMVSILIVGISLLDNNENIYGTDFIPLTNPNVGLEYYLSDHVSLGGSISLGFCSGSNRFEDGSISKKTTMVYPSLLINSTTHYLKRRSFSLYGRWGLGATLFVSKQIQNKSDTSSSVQLSPTMAGDLYPLCFCLGNKTGFFLEAGWGTKGFVNLGGYFSF